jgi:hypothetical protein
MELLILVGQDDPLDQAEGEDAPGAPQTTTGKLASSSQSYGANTKFVKKLYGQTWINQDTKSTRELLKSCIYKSRSFKVTLTSKTQVKGTVARDFQPLVFFMNAPNKDP